VDFADVWQIQNLWVGGPRLETSEPTPPGCFGKRGCKMLIIKGRRCFKGTKRLQHAENTGVSAFLTRRAAGDALISETGKAQIGKLRDSSAL